MNHQRLAIALIALGVLGTACADLTLSKNGVPNPVIAGNTITYTIVVGNNGPLPATGLTLTDAVPANTTFVSLTSPANWTCTTPPVGGTGNISCRYLFTVC